MTTDAQRYNAVARALHWSIGLLIIANIALALLGEPFEHVLWIFPVHKAIGILVLGLSVARLLWRFTYTAPPLPAAMPDWQKLAARLVMVAFYGMIILVPLSGWVMSSAGKWPISFFGLFDVMKFDVTRGTPLWEAAHEGHELMAFGMIALLVIHVVAALRHHHVLKDDVLTRMLH